MTRALLGAVVAALVLAGGASAGGWATVQLGSTPYGIGSGETWSTDLTVLQHGRTPLDGVSPTVTISNGTLERVFPAVATGAPGVYRVAVVFPSAGTWSWKIWDGFSQTHTYAPVVIGATGGAAAADDVDLGWWVAGIAAGLALLMAGLVTSTRMRRRSRLRPA